MREVLAVATLCALAIVGPAAGEPDALHFQAAGAVVLSCVTPCPSPVPLDDNGAFVFQLAFSGANGGYSPELLLVEGTHYGGTVTQINAGARPIEVVGTDPSWRCGAAVGQGVDPTAYVLTCDLANIIPGAVTLSRAGGTVCRSTCLST